jgi:hypothetical protein
MLPQL